MCTGSSKKLVLKQLNVSVCFCFMQNQWCKQKKDTVDTDGCGCYGSDDGKMEVKTEKKSEARHKHEPEDKHKTDKNKLVYYQYPQCPAVRHQISLPSE